MANRQAKFENVVTALQVIQQGLKPSTGWATKQETLSAQNKTDAPASGNMNINTNFDSDCPRDSFPTSTAKSSEEPSAHREAPCLKFKSQFLPTMSNESFEVKTPEQYPDKPTVVPCTLNLKQESVEDDKKASTMSASDKQGPQQTSCIPTTSEVHSTDSEQEAKESDSALVKASTQPEESAGYKSLPQPLGDAGTSYMLETYSPFVLSQTAPGGLQTLNTTSSVPQTEPSVSSHDSDTEDSMHGRRNTASEAQYEASQSNPQRQGVEVHVEPAEDFVQPARVDLPRLKTKRSAVESDEASPVTPPSYDEAGPVEQKQVNKRRKSSIPPTNSAVPAAAPKPMSKGGGYKSGSSGSGPRSCVHCGTLKTPLWRNGPLGPKSLCNACGVRHKLGKLTSEYSPYAPKPNVAAPKEVKPPPPVAPKSPSVVSKRKSSSQPQRATIDYSDPALAARPKRVCVASSRAVEYAETQQRMQQRIRSHSEPVKPSFDVRAREFKPHNAVEERVEKMSLSPSEGALVLLSLAGILA
mmetsp:Transcript_6244/g.7165  ORF Transcript_6244/g.7165 Transcript_6244/m.7165 type:complete len:526 (-) Transcript_6244:1886-3463(-)